MRSSFPFSLARLTCAFAIFAGASSPGSPTTAPSTAPSQAATSATGLTVAILDFEANTPSTPELGKQIGDVLLATLSGEGNITLVDRSAMSKTLQEHELSLTGLVDGNQAVKIGKLVGAKLLITGKAFVLDRKVFITAKLVGTETSLVDGIVVNGPVDGDLGNLVMSLSDKLASHIKEVGPKLMPADETASDPLPGLKQRLAGRRLPKLAVQVSENHVAERAAARIDPAVDTELKRVFLDCGFTVDDNDEHKWADDGVEVVIRGEAFSEFQARIGSLVSCSARAEVKATDRKSGSLLFSSRTTTRAADLAENTAGKTALQSAGRRMAIELLQQFDKTLPPADH